MSYENKKYVIVNVSDITEEMIINSSGTGSNSLRKTLDGSKAILKWDGDTPLCFNGMTTYNHSEILTELKKSDWTEEAE